MKNIISALYNGEVYPFEEIVSNDPNYYPYSVRAGEIAELLKKDLPAEQAEFIDELESLNININTMHGYANFLYGFRLGVRLIMELAE